MTAHAYPIPGKPRRLTAKYKHEIRMSAERTIQYLIDLVDQLDGDPDLEPYLSQGTGGPERPNQIYDWLIPAEEGDICDLGEPDVDDEPSLGSGNGDDQTHWEEQVQYCDFEAQAD